MHPITRPQLYGYLRHACLLLDCELIAARAIDGSVHMLVDLGAEKSPMEFYCRLLTWTSTWITKSVDVPSFWHSEVYACQLSPEDKDAAISLIDSAPDDMLIPLIDSGIFTLLDDKAVYCHHIIFTTFHAKLSLRLKYQYVLVGGIKDVCRDLGITVIEAAAMRNHIHILCRLPSAMSIAVALDQIRSRLLNWMHANIHFRRFEGWSDDGWAYTVTPARLQQEMMDIYRQEEIHRRHPNEMSFLYQRLGIPYVASLH